VTSLDAAGCRFFPPVVAAHLVKLACELPDDAGRSLSLWTCAELARTAVERGLVQSISSHSVQRILFSHKLTPGGCTTLIPGSACITRRSKARFSWSLP
jgi:hypothetical protein